MKGDAENYRYNCFIPINRRPTTLSQRLAEEQPELRDPTESRIFVNGVRYFSRAPRVQ